jgi:hypothetical protein
MTDELQADTQPAEENTLTVDAPRAMVAPRRVRSQQSVQGDAHPHLERVLEKETHRPTLPPKEGGENPAARPPTPTLLRKGGGKNLDAPVTATKLPGAPADSQPVDASEIASEVVEEPAVQVDPARSATAGIERRAFRPVPAAARRLEPDMGTVAASPDTLLTPVAATGRARIRSRSAFAESGDNEPVRVTIGRIEVRAPAPPPPVLPNAEPAVVPRLSLAEYLQQRDREDGR